MAYTVQFGILLIVLGFGSVVLNQFTDVQFTLLSWADDMQPGAGIIVGLIGVGLVCVSIIARRRPGTAPTTGQFPVAGQPGPYPGPQQPGPYQSGPYQQPQQYPQQGWPQQQQQQQPYAGGPQQQYPPRDQG